MRSLCYENHFSFIESRANYRAEYFAHKLTLKKQMPEENTETENSQFCYVYYYRERKILP